MLKKIAAATLAAALLTCLSTAPASAAPPTGRTYNDGVQSGLNYDIKKVVLHAASEGEPASLVATFASDVLPMDEFTVWFNTDKDTTPEMVLYATAYSNYRLVEWGTDRELECASASLSANTASIEFGPSCIATSTTMTIAVRAKNGEGKGSDRVGSIEDWPKRVKSYL